jgi:hypothetical protein
MSVRSEQTLSANMHQALSISENAMLAASAAANMADASISSGSVSAGANGANAGEINENVYNQASDFTNSNPSAPLKRTVVVNVRSSLSDLIARKSKAVWTPASTEAMKAIMQQKRFTDIKGNMETQGDLKSVVLHKMSILSQRNSFPLSLGVKISGCDNNCYSSTGEAFATITLPQTDVHTERLIQSDNVDLTYEFAAKFPGYTAQNLATKGVHEVAARRFVLIAADHPLVAAISENAESLQIGEVSMMQEGLVKISTGLYQTLLPLVQSQLDSQIRVRDFSNTSVSIAPADFSSWSEARSALMTEAKAGLQSQVESSIATATSEEELSAIRSDFNRKERDIENQVDHTVHTFSASVDINYNFLSN